MAEILTESFCERCGTRYTFESTTARRRGLRRFRTLTRGVRNFVANDDASFADAMAAAREEEARGASLQQIDAFHRTFNFCMTCRQYTCRNCWNASAGECLSCAPDLNRDVLPGAFPDLALLAPVADAAAHPDLAQSDLATSSWPVSDLPGPVEVVVPAAEAAAFGSVEEPAVATPPEELAIAALAEEPAAAALAAEPAPPTELELTPAELAAIQGALARHVDRYDAQASVPAPLASEPMTASVAPADHDATEAMTPEPEAGSTDTGQLPAPDHVSGARIETRRLLHRFRPHPSRGVPVTERAVTGDAARVAGRERPARATELVRAAAPAATSMDASSRASDAAGAEAPGAVEPLSQASAATEVPIAPAFPRGVAPEALPVSPVPEAPLKTPAVGAAPAADVSVQPTWRMVAPEGDRVEEPEPALPTRGPRDGGARRPTGATPSATWAARFAAARPLESPVWADSSRGLLAAAPGGVPGAVGIHSCVSCGLSLSATARFCRRCGSRQG
jgi:hypothetical protein